MLSFYDVIREGAEVVRIFEWFQTINDTILNAHCCFFTTCEHQKHGWNPDD